MGAWGGKRNSSLLIRGLNKVSQNLLFWKTGACLRTTLWLQEVELLLFFHTGKTLIIVTGSVLQPGIQQQPFSTLGLHLSSSRLMPSGFPHSPTPRNHRSLVHAWLLKTLTHMQTQGQPICSKSVWVCMYAHILSDKNTQQPKMPRTVYSHSDIKFMYTHTITITGKPQCSEPEYSADDVHPALPRIPLCAASLSTLVSPLFPLVVTCWRHVAMTKVGCHYNIGKEVT